MKRAAKSLASPSTAAPPVDTAESPADGAEASGVHPARGTVLRGPGLPRLVVPPSAAFPDEEPAPDADFTALEPPLEPAVENEATPRWSRPATVLLGTSAVLVASALAGGYYAWTVVSASPRLPDVVPVHLAVGAPAVAPPVPSDADLKDLLEGRWSVDGGRGLQ
jgi:hypothetical protein